MSTIIPVHALHHGTGKSSLIANVSVSLARHGQRVGVLDTGTQTSGLHTLFGLDEYHLDPLWNYFLWSDAAQEGGADAGPFLQVEQGQIAVLGGGIELTPPTGRVRDMGQLLRQGQDPELLSQGLLTITRRLQLDYLLIDTQPGILEDTLLAIAIADVLLLLLRLEPPDYQDAAVILDLAEQLNVPQIQLIANQISPTYNSQAVVTQLQDSYGYPVAGLLPFSEELLVLSSQGLFCQRHPNHPWSLAVGAIAQRLIHLSATGVPPLSHVPPPSSPSEPDTEIQTEAGLRMFDLLTLPEPERQLLNCMLRQGQISLTDAANYVGEEPGILQESLETLVEKGWVQTGEIEGELRYSLNLTSRRSSTLSAKHWHLLED